MTSRLLEGVINGFWMNLWFHLKEKKGHTRHKAFPSNQRIFS